MSPLCKRYKVGDILEADGMKFLAVPWTSCDNCYMKQCGCPFTFEIYGKSSIDDIQFVPLEDL